MKSLYLQYGCGLCAPSGWRNFDASPTLRLQKLPVLGRYIKNEKYAPLPKNVEYGDIVKGLPVSNESCQAIYCSHVLEHLALEDFRVALKHTYSLLQVGGLFRFVLPDLERLAKDYIFSEASNASIIFMEQSYLGKKTRPRGLKSVLQNQMGNSIHLWMWDYKSMATELANANFREIRRAAFGDSHDPHFQDVEDIGRWQNCLGVECVK